MKGPRHYLKALFNINEQGTPIYVLGKEGKEIGIVPGKLTVNYDEAVRVEHVWIDNTEHHFSVGQDEFLPISDPHAILDRPIYGHNVGYLFGVNPETCLPSVVGSEAWAGLNKSEVAIQLNRETQAALKDGSGLSLKWILILIGGAVLIGILWQSGFITDLIGDVVPQAAPQEAP